MTRLLDSAAALANHGLFVEVHELLEPVWFRAAEPARTALQGLIQIAVGFHHLENGNREGARSLLVLGLAKTAEAGAILPLDLPPWLPELRAVLAGLAAGESPARVPRCSVRRSGASSPSDSPAGTAARRRRTRRS